jgi:hypothetical protein
MTRRRALGLFAIGALGVACPPLLSGCANDHRKDTASASYWAAVAKEARRTEPALDPETAAKELDRSLGPFEVAAFDDPGTDLLVAVRERISDDFGSGRSLLVAGWALARTEVLLAVVADGTS